MVTLVHTGSGDKKENEILDRVNHKLGKCL